jgi:hypothetical protein
MQRLATLPCDLSSSLLQFATRVPTSHALVTVDLVHPATDKHIEKASEQPVHMVRETYADFKKYTEPYITGLPPSRIQW